MEFFNAPLDNKNNNKNNNNKSTKTKIAKTNNKKEVVEPARPVHSYSTRSKSKNKNKKEEYKKNVSSDDDDDEEGDDEDDDGWISEEEEEDEDKMLNKKGKLDEKKYTELLSTLFPSKYMKEKLEKNNSKSKNKNKKIIEEESEEEELESSSNEDDDEEESDEEEDKVRNKLKKGTKFNIIFTLGGNDLYSSSGRRLDEDEDEDEDDDEDYDEDETEDETEDDTQDDTEDEDTEEEEEEVITKKNNNNTTTTENDNNDGINKLKEMINNLSDKERKSKSIQKFITELEKDEKEKEKKQKRKNKKEKIKNTKNFKKLLREKNVMNDVRFFKDKMNPEQQKLVIKQLEEITKYSEIEKPYRLSLIDSDIPIEYKACAIKKINTLRYMDPGAGEYYKIKNWVDTFMQIPFGKNKILPLTLNDGVEKCHEFMESAKKILDEAVYGLNDAKLQIMQMVGQWLVNPSAIGTAIAIKGPMGTGKTTLVKEGISKILGRDFAFIALGGATDSSFLEGHSYTYEGSSWGKIVDILINSKSMNPVIYFDELDKVSDTPKGEEIIGILTHLTDTTQNSKFHDKYFAGIDFDISRCLFIFSYNDESKVNPILRDRMYRIHTKGYDMPQKTIISNNHLLPKIREQVAFKTDEIVIPEETIHYIINTHTEKEDGVRNLKRCLEIIHTKLNLYRLMKPGVNLFESEDNMNGLKVEFPIIVTPAIVDKLIKKSTDNGAWTAMYS
jgi:ATP-dependent Lon protease